MNEVQELKNRFDAAIKHTYKLPAKYRRDCSKMASNIHSLFRELENELIATRRKNQVTSKYNSIISQINEALQTLESYVMLAILSKGPM